MENYKIKVNDEAESKEAVELFTQLGYELFRTKRFGFVATTDDTIYTDVMGNWDEYEGQELTLPQLRDLVVLHRNDVKDATHACDGMNGAAIKLSGIWYGYNYFVNKWQPWDEIEDDEYKISDLKPIQKSLEQVLISGADALRALADGKEVERKLGIGWCDDVKKLSAETILHGVSELRIKPRTITLNGIEIPAPFEPKEGEMFYHLCEYKDCGYWYNTNKSFQALGAWRTESEIKKVVAALRGGIKA